MKIPPVNIKLTFCLLYAKILPESVVPNILMTKDRSFYKQFFSLYWVLVLNNIIVLSVSLADNIMIGAFSETALSGVTAVNQVQYIFQQLLMASGNGLVVLASQYWGQERTAEIKKISACAITVGLSASIVLFVCACVFPEGLLGLFTPNKAIIAEGVRYINIIKFTYPVFALSQILLACLRSVETVRIGFYISLVTLVVNCGINYLLIAGNFGFPSLGSEGAAIGTLTARIIELVIILIYILACDKKLRYRLYEMFTPSKTLFFDYIRISFPIITVGVMFGFSTALQTVILGHLSDAAIAANSMSSALFQTLKVASVGAASAAAVVVGKTIGRGDMSKLREYVRTLQLIFVMIGTVASILLYVLRYPILSFYSLSYEAMHLSEAFILVLCFTGFGTAYQMPSLIGIVQGGGDSKFVLKNDIINIWCICIPLALISAFVLDASPVLVVFFLNMDQITKCVPAFFKVNSYNWAKKLTK